jgi:hypothetical protein
MRLPALAGHVPTGHPRGRLRLKGVARDAVTWRARPFAPDSVGRAVRVIPFAHGRSFSLAGRGTLS